MAFDAFLKIEGIDGESADAMHSNEIEIDSYSWNVKQARSGAISTSGSISAERANFSDFTFVKALDKASPRLALACAGGEHLKGARLQICRAGGDKQPYMEVKFTDVMITGLESNAVDRTMADAVPRETVSVAFGKVEWKYTKTNVDGGGASGNVATGWDLKGNKKV